MKFSFTDDQRLFAEGLRELLANECPPTLVRDVWENGTGHSPELWAHLSGMGVLSMLAPESAGGMGGSFVDAYPSLPGTRTRRRAGPGARAHGGRRTGLGLHDVRRVADRG